jgi:trigger factor
MSIGGVPVEGGSANGHIVRLSEEHYVPGFTDQLVGMSSGQTKTFQLPFPKEHYQKNLAGRMVDFSATVTEVRERTLPEPDDAFAARLGQKSIIDLRFLIEKNLREEKEDKEEKRFESALLKAALERTRIGEIPDFLVTEEAQRIVRELEESVKQRGGVFADYLQHIGKTREQLLLDMVQPALERVKSSLLLRHLAKEHSIVVSDNEVDRDIAETKKLYEKSEEVRDALDTSAMREQVRLMVRNKKVMEWLKMQVNKVK